MIEAAEIIDNFAKGGYKLSLDQGFIHCKPTPSENLIEQLKFHKPEIITYLENKKLSPVFINLSDSGEKKQSEFLPSQGGTIDAQNSETISEHLSTCSTLTTGTLLDSSLQGRAGQTEKFEVIPEVQTSLPGIPDHVKESYRESLRAVSRELLTYAGMVKPDTSDWKRLSDVFDILFAVQDVDRADNSLNAINRALAEAGEVLRYFRRTNT